MGENHGDYYDLAQRIEAAFAEIDSDIVSNMSEESEEYAALYDEAKQIKASHPIIGDTMDGSGALSLTADEHKALAQYISLTQQMEDIERQAIYFRGPTDCFAYLKKIGVS